MDNLTLDYAAVGAAVADDPPAAVQRLPDPSPPTGAVDQPWLKSYPPGLGARIATPEHASLACFFEAAAARFRDRPALAGLGRALTYGQLEALSRQFAAYLTGTLRLQPGERVALMLPNLLQQPVAFWGALRAGLTVVAVNPLYTARELEHQLRDSGAAVLLALENFAPAVEAALCHVPVKTLVLTRLGDLLAFPRNRLVNWYARRAAHSHPVAGAISFLQALREGARLPFRASEPRPQAPALIQYTGGTTGVTKGAMLSHGNLLANIEQCHAWMQAGLPPERALIEGRETAVAALPFYHIFALTVLLLCFTRLGGLSVLIANPRDLPRMVRELGGLRCSAFAGVNTLFKGLLGTPGFAALDFSGLKFVISGGMPTEPGTARRWLETTGRAITEGYGLTEASPVVTINPPALEAFTGSIGLPLPSTECAIRDQSGHPLPPGMAGTLWVRGPQVMAGYWNCPDETALALTPDGWLDTGDIARMDQQGFLYLVDRKKDVILVSGFNVYPSEVEAVLCAHPSVRECAAVGVPDERTGEAVKVFVARARPDFDAEALRRYCRMNLAAYKVPKQVEFLDELPKSPLGKVLRRELRESASK
jgi:long-chain acyl-CoA synthetase